MSTSLPDENDLNDLKQYDRNFNNFSHSSYTRDNGNRAVSDTELRNGGKPDVLEIESLLSEEKANSHHVSRKTSVPRRNSTSQHSAHGSGWSIGHPAVESVAHHQSMLSVTSDVEPALSGVGFQGSAPAEVKEHGWKSCCCIAIIRQIFDPQLFRYVHFVLSNMTFHYVLVFRVSVMTFVVISVSGLSIKTCLDQSVFELSIKTFLEQSVSLN